MKIFHHTGRSNANADALSHAPIVEENKDTHAMVPFGIIAAINAGRSTVQEDDLSNRQRNDPKLLELTKFLKNSTHPADKKQARVLAMTKSQFHIEGGVLYHLESDGTLKVIPPTASIWELYEQAHSGSFGGHLHNAKVFQ